MNKDSDLTSQADQVSESEGNAQSSWTVEERQQIRDLLRALGIMVGLICLVMMALAVVQGWI